MIAWSSAAEFFAMGGYGLYVWGSFGMAAAVMAAEATLLRRRRHALRALLADVADEPPAAAPDRRDERVDYPPAAPSHAGRRSAPHAASARVRRPVRSRTARGAA